MDALLNKFEFDGLLLSSCMVLLSHKIMQYIVSQSFCFMHGNSLEFAHSIYCRSLHYYQQTGTNLILNYSPTCLSIQWACLSCQDTPWSIMTRCLPGEALTCDEILSQLMYYCYCMYRDGITQIAELLEIIRANEHSELVIREHTLKVNR